MQLTLKCNKNADDWNSVVNIAIVNALVDRIRMSKRIKRKFDLIRYSVYHSSLSFCVQQFVYNFAKYPVYFVPLNCLLCSLVVWFSFYFYFSLFDVNISKIVMKWIDSLSQIKLSIFSFQNESNLLSLKKSIHKTSALNIFSFSFTKIYLTA